MTNEYGIDHESVIAFKIAQLNGQELEPMPQKMMAYIEQHPELQKELSFIESFWQHSAPEQQPSANVRARFYQTLSQAQSGVGNVTEDTVHAHQKQKSRMAFWQSLSAWLAPRPVAQFAALGLCFVLGLLVNQPKYNEDNRELMSLQQEVNSLSTMVALSMLQNPSATERLNGVVYSSKVSQVDPQLTETMLTLLQFDQSTAVRLAILNQIRDSDSVQLHENTLSELALNERNTLVQLQLIQLLLEQGSTEMKAHLSTRLTEIELNEDVAAFVSQHYLATQI